MKVHSKLEIERRAVSFAPGAARCVCRNAGGDRSMGFAVKGAQVKIWLKMLDKQNVNSILSEMKGSFNVVLE
jgi:hypothetical protein